MKTFLLYFFFLEMCNFHHYLTIMMFFISFTVDALIYLNLKIQYKKFITTNNSNLISSLAFITF